MSLKVYRIDRSFFGKLNNRLKAPDLPVGAVSAVGSLFKNIGGYARENSYVLSKDDEIARFYEAYNNDWIDDQYYIRHPKKIKTDILIPANKFHQFIVREQMADMISYIRANVRVKRLEIQLFKGASIGVNLKGIIEGIPLEGEAKATCNSEFSAIIDCQKPLKASEKKKQYTWIDVFPHLQSVVDDASDNRFEIKESYDLSFGLDIKAGKAIGINTSLNANHVFKINVTTA